MIILGSLIPSETGNLCSVGEGDKDKKSKCGLLKLNEGKLSCHQEDCNENHPAICLTNNTILESKKTTRDFNRVL